MEAEAIQLVRDLAAEADGKVVPVNGRPYSERPLKAVQEPEPSSLTVHTLTGLVDYLTANVDGLKTERLVVHVVDPTEVRVAGALTPLFQQRSCYVKAKLNRDPFPFDSFLDTEQLTIRLQAQFKNVGDRADVLRLIGTVKDEQVQTRQDDGHTQKVTASAGVTLAESVEVPNPVDLAPFRTFTEVDQPISPFVLRVRKGREGIEAGLFEADGGAWRNEAILSIAAWLGERLDLRVIA